MLIPAIEPLKEAPELALMAHTELRDFGLAGLSAVIRGAPGLDVRHVRPFLELDTAKLTPVIGRSHSDCMTRGGCQLLVTFCVNTSTLTANSVNYFT